MCPYSSLVDSGPLHRQLFVTLSLMPWPCSAKSYRELVKHLIIILIVYSFSHCVLSHPGLAIPEMAPDELSIDPEIILPPRVPIYHRNESVFELDDSPVCRCVFPLYLLFSLSSHRVTPYTCIDEIAKVREAIANRIEVLHLRFSYRYNDFIKLWTSLCKVSVLPSTVYTVCSSKFHFFFLFSYHCLCFLHVALIYKRKPCSECSGPVSNPTCTTESTFKGRICVVT